MNYVLVNPVVSGMYPREALDSYLAARGYVRVECRENWREIVLGRYREQLERTGATVVDARCPMAVRLFRDVCDWPRTEVAPIEPILICCAREISTRADLAGGDKLVITPCRALAEMGNALRLRRTRFASWRDFIEEDCALRCARLEASPIPPGYFSGLPWPGISLSGAEEIEAYFSAGPREGVRMIEMLYCRDGCHHGDGVALDG